MFGTFVLEPLAHAVGRFACSSRRRGRDEAAAPNGMPPLPLPRTEPFSNDASRMTMRKANLPALRDPPVAAPPPRGTQGGDRRTAVCARGTVVREGAGGPRGLSDSSQNFPLWLER